MATPMQYELLNKIMWIHRSGNRFLPHASMSQEAADKTLGIFAAGIGSGEACLVDASDIAARWLPFGPLPRPEVRNADGTVDTDPSRSGYVRDVQCDNQFLNDTARPNVGRNIYSLEMPWPAAIFTARVYKEDGFTAWMVIAKDGGWRVWDFAIGITHDYGVWMGSLSDRAVSVDAEKTNPVNPYHLVTAMTLSLASAKNASWVETAPNRAIRRRNPAVAGIRFRHIEIDMGKPKRKGEARDVESHGVAWHHRRGHWAYVSPDRPLFGHHGPKNSGWFWRPYTEVGDKQHGEIVQDYSVKANLPSGAA